VYFKNILVAPSDCEPGKGMTLAALLNRLQDAAGEAAEELGASVPRLLAEGFTWMLVKYRLRAGRMPLPGEDLRLATWHFPHGRLYSLRAFELTSGETRLVRADSCWVLVDLGRRKPVHIGKVLPSLFQAENPPIPFEFEKVESCGSGPWSASLQVEDPDIDENGHVNHIRYLEWATEALPAGWRQDKAFRGFDAEFHGEGRSGERLEIFARAEPSETGGHACLHGILRPSDGAELFRMRTVWE